MTVMKLTSLLNRIGFYLILGVTISLPLFFLPFTSEFYEFNKHFLLLISSGLLFLLWTITFVLEKQVRIIRNPLSLPVFFFVVSAIISTLTQTPNRLDTLMEPGSTATLVALFVFFTVSLAFIKSKLELNLIIRGLIASFSILAVTSLIWGSGLMEKVIPWSFAKNSLWTPSGNALTTLVCLLILIPLIVINIAKQKQNSAQVLGLSVVLFLFVVTSGLISYRVFKTPGNRPVFLSQSASWSISMEALKLSPVLGTGPSTYLFDFTRFKPLGFNLTPNWSIRFTSASNYYLQILTTMGLLGLAAFTFLGYKILSLFVRAVRSSSDSPDHTTGLAAGASAVLILFTFFIVPPSITTLFVFFSLLSLMVVSLKLMGSALVHESHIDIVAASDTGIRTPILPWISLFLALVIILPGGYTLAKVYLAEVAFQSGLIAASGNQGKNTYESLIKAINLNPYHDTYHVAASQTELLLANSAASKKELTADDRTLITTLIQQSIQEAKNAVSLNPTKITNVENLAAVYQNLLSFAEGADQWTLASYQQAIALDPANPNLHISLGGLYFAAKNYDEALNQFRQAADLKPDLANAYYNISATYKAKKDYKNAYTAMQAVITKLDRNSPDFLKAQGELEELAKLAGTTAQTPTNPGPSELEAPKPLPSPKVNPPLALPTDSGPKTSGAPTPSPIPTATPAVSPAVSPAVTPIPGP
jgi:tetratricopeptide (TPR) repeat protein